MVEGLEGRTLLSQAGGLDTTFGVGGVEALSRPTNTSLQVNGSVVQADGKTVVVGRLGSSTLGILGNVQVVVARYDANGTLDTTFGTGGYFTSPTLSTLSTALTPLDASARSATIDTQGRIVVAANVGGSADVFRLSANGTLDTSFGVGGITTLGTVNLLGTQLDYATSVVILPGGQVAVGGADNPLLGVGHDVAAIEMLSASGTVDLTFGTAGVATIPQSSIGLLSFLPIVPILSSGVFLPGGAVNLVEQADGKFIVVANASPNASLSTSVIAVTRFNANGTLDTTYGVGGAKLISTATLGVPGGEAYANSVELQTDGKLVIGGTIAVGSSIVPRLLVLRMTTSGSLDPTFGLGGVSLPGGSAPLSFDAGAVAIQNDGKIVLADSASPVFVRLEANGQSDPSFGAGGTSVLSIGTGGFVGLTILADGKFMATRGSALPALVRLLGEGADGDYDNDGISDPAIYIPSLGEFAYQASGGGIGQIISFGPAGAGLSLPAPGAYFGGGVDDLAIYMPAQGAFAVLPLNGQPGVITQFGMPGLGNSIPAEADYDGSGKTEYAVYLPSVATFIYRPGNGGRDVAVPFGIPGAGQSIPVPADYFGTGQDDIAVYLPALGSFAIRNPATRQDSIIPFGAPGAGNSIPVPGDYDGSGRTELAVYIPALGDLIYRPANGGADVVESFGFKGAGLTLPAPGDYDGSGKTEVAAYFPSLGQFAYRPANGGTDLVFNFGAANKTIPFVAASATDTNSSGVSTMSAESIGVPVPDSVQIPLTPDILDSIAGTTPKKHTNGT